MLYILEIDELLQILTDIEGKDFVAINFSKYYKPTKEELNLIKVA